MNRTDTPIPIAAAPQVWDEAIVIQHPFDGHGLLDRGEVNWLIYCGCIQEFFLLSVERKRPAPNHSNGQRQTV
jgi:hypothetical protein